MTTTITSATATFQPGDVGKTMNFNRRLVWPWWAMFARWEQEERVIESASRTAVVLGPPRRVRYKLDWQL